MWKIIETFYLINFFYLLSLSMYKAPAKSRWVDPYWLLKSTKKKIFLSSIDYTVKHTVGPPIATFYILISVWRLSCLCKGNWKNLYFISHTLNIVWPIFSVGVYISLIRSIFAYLGCLSRLEFVVLNGWKICIIFFLLGRLLNDYCEHY